MKKVLVTAMALGLTLGVAANALALDKPGRASEVEATTAPVVPKATAPGVALWSVTGQWVLAGAYIGNGMPGQSGGANPYYETGADAFYIHSFKVLPVLQINDKVSVKGEIRFVDRSVFGAEGTTKNINAYHVYLEYMSAIGKTRFGRTPAGAWGGKFNNNSGQGNRLMLWGNWMPENWGMLLFTQKITETDVLDTRIIPAGPDGLGLQPTPPYIIVVPGDPAHVDPDYFLSDGDRDGYYIDVSYKADMGKTTAALFVDRYAAGDIVPYTKTNLWVYGKYAWDNVGLAYELDWGFGEASDTVDQKTLAFMADLSYVSGDLKFGGLFIYGSGDNDATDTKSEAAFANTKGTGRDYNPYQIMMGDYMNMWNADKGSGKINSSLQTTGGNVGIMSIGGYVGYKVSPKMSISGEIGWFSSLEESTGWDDSLGVEFGVGMSYKVYDNLTYGAHFSYLATGDFFKQGVSDASTEDVYFLAHALSMKF